MRRFACALLALFIFALPASAGTDRFTLDCQDVDIAQVIRLLGAQTGRNLVADGSIKPQRVSIHLADVTYDQALATILAAYGLQTHREGAVTIVGDAASMNRRFPDDAALGGTTTRVYSLQHATLSELVDTLQNALAPGTVVVGDKRTNTLIVTASASTVARAGALIAALDTSAYGAGGGTVTQTVQLHNVKASDAVTVIRGAVPDDTLFADDRQNVIVVRGNSETQATVRALVAGLDLPGPQVMFEVRVADIEPVNDTSNVGVAFGGNGFGSGALAQFPYTITRSSVVVNAQINALVQHGRASILAQPRVATLNNHEASLLVGEQYPVVTLNQQTGFPSVQTIDVGVRLRLTPTIGADGSITAELHPEYSQIIGFNNDFPIIANRKLDATLRVHDGETIVLGGLFQDVDSDTIAKLPVLGDLPVLGAFFRNREKMHTRDEVVFFITPRLIETAGSSGSTR